MNILFIHNGSDLYGASRSILRLSSALVGNGSHVFVLMPSRGPLTALLEEQGVTCILDPDLPVLARSQSLAPFALGRLVFRFVYSPFKVALLIRRHAIEIVHTNTTVTVTAALGARLSGVPHVWHIREFFSDMPAIWTVLQWYIASLSSCIICNSRATSMQFHAYIRRRKVRIIYNSVPEDDVSEITPADRHRIREAFGLQEGRVTIGVVGRIKYRRKGQEVLVEAAALLADKYPEAMFILIGTPFPGNEGHLDRLKRRIRDLGLEKKVILAGDIEDMRAIYALLDVVVMPSGMPEPFGNVLIEAMCYALPVVGTDLGGIPEIIDDGQNGFLVPPNDPAALAKALEKLLAEPWVRQEMGRLGRQHFVKRFRFTTMLSEILDAYEDLDARRKGIKRANVVDSRTGPERAGNEIVREANGSRQ